MILYLLGFIVLSPHLNQRSVLGIDITLHPSLLWVSDMNNYWMVWIGNPTWHHNWTNLTKHYGIAFYKLFLSDTTILKHSTTAMVAIFLGWWLTICVFFVSFKSSRWPPLQDSTLEWDHIGKHINILSSEAINLIESKP